MHFLFNIFLIINSIYAAANDSFKNLEQKELGFNVFVENVGQGNGLVVIDNKTGKRMVVDAGSSKHPENHPLKHFVASIKEQPQYLASSPITFIVSHPDKDHLNLFVQLLTGIAEKIKNNKNIKFYLGGPFEKYLTSQDALKFLSAILEMEKSQVVSLSHALTKAEIQTALHDSVALVKKFTSNDALGFEDVKSAVTRTVGLNIKNNVRPCILRSPIPEFSEDTRVGTEIVIANAGHSSVRVYPIADGTGPAINSFEFDTTPSEVVNPDENTSSIVLRFSFFNNAYSMLITGDATGITTDRILRHYPEAKVTKGATLESDFVLACHHGSITEESNNAEWVDTIKPKHVIFSSEQYDGYHHPQFDAFWNYLRSSRLENAGKEHDFVCARKSSRNLPTSQHVIKPAEDRKSGDYTWHKFKTDKSIYSTMSSGNIEISVALDKGVNITTEK